MWKIRTIRIPDVLVLDDAVVGKWCRRDGLDLRWYDEVKGFVEVG